MDERTKEEMIEEAVKLISNASNALGSSDKIAKAFVKAIQKDHRTLQQNIWRMIFKAIAEYSEASHDLRNEGAVRACKFITDCLKDNRVYLPFV